MIDITADNPAVTRPAAHQLDDKDVYHGEPDSVTTNGASSQPGNVLTNGSHARIVVSKYDQGWRRVVRNFSPSWFSTTMGTGIVANLLFAIPFHASWLYWLSVVFFGLNTILFFLAFAVSSLRYTLYPEIWSVMIRDPNNSLFLATVPMGFATMIEMWVNVCIPSWGPWAIDFAWILWMIDSIVAAAVTVTLCFTHTSRPTQTSLSSITAAQLLPVAAPIVAAGTGARIAETLTNPEHALGTITTCYILWSIGVPLAMAILVMYYQRLTVHKLPPREVLVSCFLPLGPLGFGGYGIMYLGKVSQKVFPITGTLHPLAGDIFYIQGFLVALVLWGFGLVWLVFALATIYTSRPIPFNMGWWGFTFPLGVYATSTIQLGIEMPSKVFRILGTIFGVAVILLWFVVATGTARGAWTGRLFSAPCLAHLKEEHIQKGIVETSRGAKAA